jgi:hypothetical protein
MNTGQMMLVSGAMILLGTTVFTVNRNSLQQGTVLRQTKLGIYAASLATSYIQKASGMNYDEKTVVRPPLATIPAPATIFTASADLGPDIGGKNIYGPPEWVGKDTSFDDFDDYNGFTIDTSITNVDRFHVSAQVYYIDTIPPAYSPSAVPTWLKRMDIAINSSVDRKVFETSAGDLSGKGVDTIKLSYIFSFY